MESAAAHNTDRVQNTGVVRSVWAPSLPLPALPSVVVASLPGSQLRLTSSCTDAHLQAGRTHQRQSRPPSHSGSAWVASERRVRPGH